MFFAEKTDDLSSKRQDSANLSHSHTLNSGNTSEWGTEATAGIRHSGSTSGMSEHSSGWFVVAAGAFRASSANITDGSTFIDLGVIANKCDFDTDQLRSGKQISMNIKHTHNLPSSYIYGGTDGSGTTESRPSNYTYRIWVRTA